MQAVSTSRPSICPKCKDEFANVQKHLKTGCKKSSKAVQSFRSRKILQQVTNVSAYTKADEDRTRMFCDDFAKYALKEGKHRTENTVNQYRNVLFNCLVLLETKHRSTQPFR